MSTCLAGVSTHRQAQEFGRYKVATEINRSPGVCDTPVSFLCDITCNNFIIYAGLELLRAKYTEILACFPENYGATIQCLQNYLDDSDIAEIVSLSSGHNQKILDCLVQKVKREEDLLDFCEILEKISGAPPLLKLIVEQIRKGTYISAYVPTYMYAYTYVYVCTYVHTYIHAYIHWYVRTYIRLHTVMLIISFTYKINVPTCVHTCYTEVVEKLQMMSSPIKSDLVFGGLAPLPVQSMSQSKYCTLEHDTSWEVMYEHPHV